MSKIKDIWQAMEEGKYETLEQQYGGRLDLAQVVAHVEALGERVRKLETANRMNDVVFGVLSETCNGMMDKFNEAADNINRNTEAMEKDHKSFNEKLEYVLEKLRGLQLAFLLQVLNSKKEESDGGADGKPGEDGQGPPKADDPAGGEHEPTPGLAGGANF